MNKRIVVIIVLVFGVVLRVNTADDCTGVCCGSNDSGQATYYPHETDCGKFYECNFGRPILFVCPEGLYFDPILNTCNWNVDCGNLSTSTVVPRTTPSSVILTKLIQNDSVILP